MHSVVPCPPAARISLLGGFGLHLRGERVELPHTSERLISFLALQAGLSAVAVEPLRETGHAAVISAHLAEGNLIEASRQYEQLRDLLRVNLGTVPSAHLRMLLRNGHVMAA